MCACSVYSPGDWHGSLPRGARPAGRAAGCAAGCTDDRGDHDARFAARGAQPKPQQQSHGIAEREAPQVREHHIAQLALTAPADLRPKYEQTHTSMKEIMDVMSN